MESRIRPMAARISASERVRSGTRTGLGIRTGFDIRDAVISFVPLAYSKPLPRRTQRYTKETQITIPDHAVTRSRRTLLSTQAWLLACSDRCQSLRLPCALPRLPRLQATGRGACLR